jgi:hypothetical protein
MITGRRRRISTLLFALFVPALSASATPVAPPNETRWRVNWADEGCELFRDGADSPYALKIQHQPMQRTASADLGIRGLKASPIKDGQPLDIVLLPSRQRFVARHSAARLISSGAIVSATMLDEGVIAGLETSTGLAFETNHMRLGEIHFASSTNALSELRKCTDDLLSRWGIDASALARLKQRAEPVQPLHLYIRANDYPAEALRSGVQGAIRLRYDIGVDGRMSSCRSTDPASNPMLVKPTCNLFMRRARFRPAIGADGQPTVSPGIINIEWRMYSSRPQSR